MKAKNSNNSATNVRPIRRKSATNPLRFCVNFASLTQKNQARLWIPVETSLLIRYEFAALSPQTRYAFVAILLYCGANRINEIPLDAKFMSNVLVIDERTLQKSFDELLFQKLLVEKKEREEREERKEQTDKKRLTTVCRVWVLKIFLKTKTKAKSKAKSKSRKWIFDSRF